LTALKIALVAAGQRVRTNGDKPFDAKKILREVNKDPKRAQKIMSAAALKKFVAARQLQGKSIVFANGCFDLLHAGHLQLLEFAKQQGDVLVVAVDSDDNVRALKGPARPVQDQATRAGNIAALASVDAVCVFGETMPDADLLTLIHYANPDVLVKGEDYATKQVVGAEMVEGRGGRIALCPLLPGTSTTALVNKIRMTT
jgi:D-beta-D-heptose 7-phosphate kinase/D-beta-D-heptose 1-phosphate adenosyltransferase